MEETQLTYALGKDGKPGDLLRKTVIYYVVAEDGTYTNLDPKRPPVSTRIRELKKGEKTSADYPKRLFSKNEQTILDKSPSVRLSMLGAASESQLSGGIKMDANRRLYLPWIKKTAASYDIPYEVLEAIIWTESRFKNDAASPMSAVGLMQIIPGTARDGGLRVEKHVDEKTGEVTWIDDRTDYRKNIFAGAAYLKSQRLRHEFLADMLRAYNAGPGRLSEFNDPARADEEFIPEENVKYSQYVLGYLQMRYGEKVFPELPEITLPPPGMRLKPPKGQRIFFTEPDLDRFNTKALSPSIDPDYRAVVEVDPPTAPDKAPPSEKDVNAVLAEAGRKENQQAAPSTPKFDPSTRKGARRFLSPDLLLPDEVPPLGPFLREKSVDAAFEDVRTRAWQSREDITRSTLNTELIARYGTAQPEIMGTLYLNELQHKLYPTLHMVDQQGLTQLLGDDNAWAITGPSGVYLRDDAPDKAATLAHELQHWKEMTSYPFNVGEEDESERTGRHFREAGASGQTFAKERLDMIVEQRAIELGLTPSEEVLSKYPSLRKLVPNSTNPLAPIEPGGTSRFLDEGIEPLHDEQTAAPVEELNGGE